MNSLGTVLVSVLTELQIPYKILDREEVVFALDLGRKKPHYIVNTIMGVNSEFGTKICQDKWYTYQVLKNVVAMPVTYGYLDPAGRYGDIAEFGSIPEIVADIKEKFTAPLIIKANQGSFGYHVFLCTKASDIESFVKTIFDQDNSHYDHVCLAQQHIAIEQEWRVIVYKGEIQFLYEKNTSNAIFHGNLSPLHWEKASADLVTDGELRERIQQFIAPIFETIDLTYTGLDVVKDTAGKFWLIEMNSKPGFSLFIEDNPQAEPVKKLYRTILSDLKNNYNLETR